MRLIIIILTLSSFTYAHDLRVITFNIGMGVLFKSPLTYRIKSVFKHDRRLKNFHIIGLQESCNNHRGPIELFKNILIEKFGNAYEVFVPANPDSTEKCFKGQTILSAYPIINHGGIQLPRVGALRSTTWADIDVNGKTVRVYNLHLSNRQGKNYIPISGRWKQGRIVLDHLVTNQYHNPDVAHIALGDFNSLNKLWNPWSWELTIRNFAEYLTPTIRRYYPTMVLPYKTDWIFYDSHLKLRRSRIIPKIFSDHLPVVADFDFKN